MFFGYNMNMPVSDYIEKYAQEQLKDQNYRSRMLNMAIETKVITALKDMVTIDVKELQHQHEEEHEHSHDHEAAHSH